MKISLLFGKDVMNGEVYTIDGAVNQHVG